MLLGLEFTSIQEAFIQNQICDAAEQKIALEFDPTNPQPFIQKEAALVGQIRILTYLLTISEASRRAKSTPGVR